MPHDDFDLYAAPPRRQTPRGFNPTTPGGHTPRQLAMLEALKRQAFPLSRGPGGPMEAIIPTEGGQLGAGIGQPGLPGVYTTPPAINPAALARALRTAN